MITGKILTGITSIFLLSVFMTTTTLADTSINISGNGSRSDNTVEVDRTRTFNLSQNNDTSITNSVSIQNNTGHNEASGNTKGDVRIHTGDAHADVNIVNRAGVNVAHVNGCCEGDNLNID